MCLSNHTSASGNSISSSKQTTPFLLDDSILNAVMCLGLNQGWTKVFTKIKSILGLSSLLVICFYFFTCT